MFSLEALPCSFFSGQNACDCHPCPGSCHLLLISSIRYALQCMHKNFVMLALNGPSRLLIALIRSLTQVWSQRLMRDVVVVVFHDVTARARHSTSSKRCRPQCGYEPHPEMPDRRSGAKGRCGQRHDYPLGHRANLPRRVAVRFLPVCQGLSTSAAQKFFFFHRPVRCTL
jgi:hypothetical protein